MIDQISVEQLVDWFNDALSRYPVGKQAVISAIRKKPWNEVKSEITEAILTDDSALVDEFLRILDADLILLGVDDILAARQDRQTVHIWETMNKIVGNHKLNMYVLYRKFGGNPRLCIGKTRIFRRKILI
jgi:hypothetical protein